MHTYCHYCFYYFSPDKFAVAVDGYSQLCDVNTTNPDDTNIEFCQVRKRKKICLPKSVYLSVLQTQVCVKHCKLDTHTHNLNCMAINLQLQP